MSNFKVLIAEHVNSEKFFTHIQQEISSMKTPENRFKAWMELVSFVSPKVKAEDPALTSGDTSIEIVYVVNDASEG